MQVDLVSDKAELTLLCISASDAWNVVYFSKLSHKNLHFKNPAAWIMLGIPWHQNVATGPYWNWNSP